MVIQEIHSHVICETRQTIEVDFTISDDGEESTHNLEIFIEDLEDYCDLFDEINWYNDDDDGGYYDDTNSLQLKREVNIVSLQEGLNNYINKEGVI